MFINFPCWPIQDVSENESKANSNVSIAIECEISEHVIKRVKMNLRNKV